MTENLSKLSQGIAGLYRAAKKRLLLLDYDGTLAEFADEPAQAKPTSEIIELLRKLSTDTKNTVMILSGRDAKTLDEWFGKLPIGLVAEHGAFVKKNSEWNKVEGALSAWQSKVLPILSELVAKAPGSFVESKQTALVWHYRTVQNLSSAKAEAAKLLKKLESVAESHELRVTEEMLAVEVRPSCVDKGSAAEQWLKDKDIDFILCAGDSTTDEDMFVAMPNQAITIKVGKGKTAAKYMVSSPAELLSLLTQLQHKL